jgi:hypothetical protein
MEWNGWMKGREGRGEFNAGLCEVFLQIVIFL